MHWPGPQPTSTISPETACPRRHGIPITHRGALNAPKQARIFDRASGIGITNRADRHDNKPTETAYPPRHRPVVQ